MGGYTGPLNGESDPRPQTTLTDGQGQPAIPPFCVGGRGRGRLLVLSLREFPARKQVGFAFLVPNLVS